MFYLLCSIPGWSHKMCESHNFANPFHGRYCPTEGIRTHISSWSQCKLFCVQASRCQSINYDLTENKCTYFTATCPQAISHPSMAFVLFTGKEPEQCMEWIPRENSNPSGDRSVTKTNKRFVARMQKDGNDYIGLMYTSLICHARDDDGIFKSYHGYPCQYLRIRDGCTPYYVSYELGTPLPPKVLIGGHAAAGLPVYIGIRDGAVKPGYYIHGSNRFVSVDGNVTENVKLLVSL